MLCWNLTIERCRVQHRSQQSPLTHRLCKSQYSVHVQEQRFTEAERLTEEARRSAREAHLKAEEALSKVCTSTALPCKAQVGLLLPGSKSVIA